MALLNVGDVVQAVAALHDDPGQTAIDFDYVIPFLNLRWSNLVTNLSMLGLQYSEVSAVITVKAGTTDLSKFMLPGQPLASFMVPISLEWKLVGADDTEYNESDAVREVDDVPDGTQGLLEYSFQGGTLQVTDSSVDVTARVKFKGMDATLVDADDALIRGAGDILAYRAAELLAIVRGMPVLKVDLRLLGDTALDDFLAMNVMRQQANFYTLPPTHRRGCSFGRGVSLAPSRST